MQHVEFEISLDGPELVLVRASAVAYRGGDEHDRGLFYIDDLEFEAFLYEESYRPEITNFSAPTELKDRIISACQEKFIQKYWEAA